MNTIRTALVVFVAFCVIFLADCKLDGLLGQLTKGDSGEFEWPPGTGVLHNKGAPAVRKSKPRTSRKPEKVAPYSQIIVFKEDAGPYSRKLRIDCPVYASGAERADWKKDGLTFETEEYAREDTRVKSIKGSKGSFHIYNVTEDDQGIYECTAAFGNGERRANVTLTVKERNSTSLTREEKEAIRDREDKRIFTGDAPLFLKRREVPSGAPTMLGGELELDCPAFGTPEPRYRWYKDGTEVVFKAKPRFPGQDESGREKSGKKTSVYKIEEMTLGDAGNYTCEAFNIFGAIRRDFSVKVDDCIDEKPKIKRVDATLSKVLPGGNTTLSCLVKSCVPSHTVIGWHKTSIDDATFHQNIDILGCSRNESGENLFRCIFDITNFNASHVGNYLCYAGLQRKDGSQLKDASRLMLEFDTRPVPEESSMQRPKKNLYYAIGGIASVVAISLVLLCVCVCRGCCCKSKKEDGLVTKSSSSTFRRQVAPDYVITGRQEGVGHYDYADCAKGCSQPFSSPPSPKSFTSFANHSVHESLLKSPDMMRKGDGSATEYEDVAEDLSVYCTQHPPSVVSSYVTGYYDPSARYVQHPRLSTLH